MLRLALLSCAALVGASVTHLNDPLCCGWEQSPLFEQASTTVSVTFYLKETNGDQLKQEALAVSDPASAQYGDHLSTAQIYDLTAPAQESVDAVVGWLSANDVEHVVEHGRRVRATMALADAAALFRTEFSELSHADSGRSLTRAGAFELPDAVDAAVAAVFGLHGLPLPPRQALKGGEKQPAKVTPAVLAKTYSISGAPKPSGSAKNHQAVAEFQGQTMANKDLTKFFKTYVPDAKAGDDTVAKFVGDKNKQSAQDESSLDIQYIMGNNAGLKTEFWLFNPDDFCADLAKWTSLILETPDAPLVHSVSYGWQGALSQIQCSDAKATVVDSNFVKLAAKGVTIIFASGDSGSGYDPDSSSQCDGAHKKGHALAGTVLKRIKGQFSAGDCCESAAMHKKAKGWTFKKHQRPTDALDVELKAGICTVYRHVNSTTADPKATSARISNKPTLWPSWPASSPWVTSVGATRFVGQTVGHEEMASDQFGSGGGFSQMFNQTDASWQSAAVAKYLANAPGLPPAGSFPPQGRATPDVSALGEGYMVFIAGDAQPIGGTSASTPAFAGMVSLLNEARIQSGGKPMGFLNPWIYNHTEAFTDVTIGSNKIGRGDFALKYGFNCTAGWDPVTGVGTPVFTDMLKAALA